MSERLVVRLGSQAQDPIFWVTWSEEEGDVIGSGVLPGVDSLATLTERAGGRPVEVLVDSSALYFTQVELPAKAQAQALKALPFMLEEELSEDVDTLHFVPSTVEDGIQSVVVVSHKQMQTWLNWLAAAQLPAKKIVPDVLALPLVPDSELSLLQLNQQVLLRTRNGGGMVLDRDWLPSMGETLAGEGRPWASFTPTALPDGIRAFEQPLELPMKVLTQGFSHCSVNMLIGAYAPTREFSKLVKTWSKVAVAAGIFFALALAQKGVTWYQMEQEQIALRAQGEQIYRQLFPEVNRVPNPRVQLEAKVKALGTGSSQGMFIPMMAKLEEAFRQVPQVRPTGLRFDASRTELRLQLVGKSFEQFEQFKNLASHHFEVESGAVNNDESGVSGIMTVRAK